MTQESQARCGTIALVGRPNAGKSTLLNALVGSKLAIVTPKAQTTRQALRGIQIVEQSQLIFVDAPGIFTAAQRYEQAMVANAWNNAKEADILLQVVDVSAKKFEADIEIAQKLKHSTQPRALVLNKIDIVKKPKLLEVAMELNAAGIFHETFMISAEKAQGLDVLQQWMAKEVPPGEWLYPEDHLSDAPVRFLAAEITREKLFLRLREELPYGLMVDTEGWEQRQDGSVKINQIIIVQREAHKKIILGEKGAQLKAIGQSARRDISKLLECEVHLFLFVKVIPDWKERPEYLLNIQN